MTHTQAPATITWRRVGSTDYTSTTIDLAHGRSRGLTDERTAQRVIAISHLGDLALVDDVLVVDIAHRCAADVTSSTSCPDDDTGMPCNYCHAKAGE